MSMSAAWSSVGHHWIVICFEVIMSRMKWCRTSMCFMHELVSVVFVANAIALWLSHHIVVGRVGLEPRSVRMVCNQIASWGACVELMLSASVDESAGVTWALLLQVMVAPAIMKMYLLVDLHESTLPAQSASLKPCAIADKLLSSLPSYTRERSCVPFRYRITRFAAIQCSFP